MFIESGPGLEVLKRDLKRQRLKINANKYNIYIGHPEAVMLATQALKPEELIYNIFIDNVFLPKNFCALIKDEELRNKILFQKGLVDSRGGVR